MMPTYAFNDFDNSFNLEASRACEVPSQDMPHMIPADEFQQTCDAASLLPIVDTSTHLQPAIHASFLAPVIKADSYNRGQQVQQCSAVGEMGAEQSMFLPLTMPHGASTCGVPRVDGSDDCAKTVPEQIRCDVFPVKGHRGEGARETARRERRRAQNRRAAQRCRAKRKLREMTMLQEMEKELQTMRNMETELHRLTSEKQELEMALIQHGLQLRLAQTEGSPVAEIESVLPFCLL